MIEPARHTPARSEAPLSPRLQARAQEARSRVSTEDLTLVLISNSWMMGGMEAHLEALATGLVARKFRTIVIIPGGPGVAPLREALTRAGVEVYVPSTTGQGWRGRLARIRELISLVRSCRPCIVHVHISGMSGGAIPALAAKLAGARAVVRTEHEPPSGTVSWLTRLRTRLRDLPLDRIICVSRANLEAHVRDLGRDRRKFTAIPNSVRTDVFRPRAASGSHVREFAGAAEGTFLVGTVSRLVGARKGLEYFVDMARMLSSEGTSFRFVIVGEGELREALERRAAGTVTFLGRYPDAAECYAAFDAFVLPSLWEGGPITVLEAMSMARPVVATGVGMVPDVIQDGINGRIVPIGDASALAQAVRWIAENPLRAVEMGQCARETMQARFSEPAILDAVCSLYRQLGANRHRSDA